MSKAELLKDIVSAAFNARAHEKHGAEVRRDASSFEDDMRDTLTATIPSQVTVLACNDILVFERPGWMKIQGEYLEIEEQADRVDAANQLCTGPRECAWWQQLAKVFLNTVRQFYDTFGCSVFTLVGVAPSWLSE